MKVVLSLPMTNHLWVEVEADILFDIAPHLAGVATFAIHNSPDTFGMWNISNIETGMWIMQAETRAQAIRAAEEKLATKTVADFERAYEKVFNKLPQLDCGAC